MSDDSTTGPDPSISKRARAQQDEALERVLQSEEIREILTQADLPVKDVRREVRAGLANHPAITEREAERLTATETVLAARRGPRRLAAIEDRALSATRYAVQVVMALAAVLGAAVGVYSIVAGEERHPLESSSLVLGVGLIVVLVIVLAERLLRSTSGERSAHAAVLAARSDARHRLDELIERQVRGAINDLLQTRFDRHLRPLDVSGLADLSDSSYDVSTASSDGLVESLERLSAGSLGIAGSRGAGKSTLLRRVAEGRLEWDAGNGLLGIEAPAPVRYDSREFVPHLFAKLCLAVLGPQLDARRLRAARREARNAQLRAIAGLAAATLAYLVVIHVLALASALPLAAVTVVVAATPTLLRLRFTRPDSTLEGLAQRNLDRLRFLETQSEQWGAEISTSLAKLTGSKAISRAAQPWTMPELISDYGAFVRQITQDRSLVIGIDELDKMASVEDAQRFLNEIKALFGQARTYYLVTLSDEAMSSFESRGLPLRDVFDSVFDDVLHVEPLTLTESASVLRKRAVGIAPPFVGLCHVMSGGLPRELIRMARESVKFAETTKRTGLADIARHLAVDRTIARQLAGEVVAGRHLNGSGTQPVLTWLRGLARQPDLGQLYERTEVEPVLFDLRAAGEPQPLELLVMELAAAAYHAATVADFFERVDEANYDSAQRAEGTAPCALDVLASGMRDLALAPEIAWNDVSDFRRMVTGLAPREYPGVTVDSATADGR